MRLPVPTRIQWEPPVYRTQIEEIEAWASKEAVQKQAGSDRKPGLSLPRCSGDFFYAANFLKHPERFVKRSILKPV